MRPNILYLNSHDTGQYLQPYGHAVSTPNLQALAEQGALFRQAFCAAPTCSPSRAALLTGQAAHSSGMLGLAHRGFKLNDEKQHVAYWLKHEQGYHTALAGGQHVVDREDPSILDYDTIMKDRSKTVEGAAAFLDAYRDDKPFYLEVGFFDTHRYGDVAGHLGPFSREGPRGDARYVRPPAPLPDTLETRRDLADFADCVSRLDADIGAVLTALEQSGLDDNTLVIYTTDHGIAFPNMKCSLTDHGTKVALIVRGPDGFEGGKVFDSLVSHLDLFPTLCDLLDAPQPAHLQGRSLLPLVQGETEAVREAVFAEVNFHASYEPKRALRTTRYKYIRRFDDRTTPVLPNCDDSPSKTLWLEHGWAERPLAEEQLYDLFFDPNEANNLVDDVRYRDVLEDMKDRLQTWMEETADPLLKGGLEPPKGIELNPVDGTSPNEPTYLVRLDE